MLILLCSGRGEPKCGVDSQLIVTAYSGSGAQLLWTSAPFDSLEVYAKDNVLRARQDSRLLTSKAQSQACWWGWAELACEVLRVVVDKSEEKGIRMETRIPSEAQENKKSQVRLAQ